MSRNVYVAIMKAAKRGVGLRLTADECWALRHDDAIATAAINAEYGPAYVGTNDGLVRLGPKLAPEKKRK